MKNFINSIISNILQLWDEKKYILAFIMTVISTVIPLLLLTIIFLLLKFIFNFLTEHLALLSAIGFFLIFSSGLSIDSAWRKKETTVNDSPISNDNAETRELDSTYKMLLTIFFDLITDIAESARLIRPASPKDIIYYEHYQRITESVIAYQFLCRKNGNLSAQDISSIIEQNLTVRINAGEYDCLGQKHYLYEGYCYPILIIHKVIDKGAYYVIQVVIANKRYCQFLKQQQQLYLSGYFSSNDNGAKDDIF